MWQLANAQAMDEPSAFQYHQWFWDGKDPAAIVESREEEEEDYTYNLYTLTHFNM